MDMKLKSNSFEGLAPNLEMQHVTGFTKGLLMRIVWMSMYPYFT